MPLIVVNDREVFVNSDNSIEIGEEDEDGVQHLSVCHQQNANQPSFRSAISWMAKKRGRLNSDSSKNRSKKVNIQT